MAVTFSNQPAVFPLTAAAAHVLLLQPSPSPSFRPAVSASGLSQRQLICTAAPAL